MQRLEYLICIFLGFHLNILLSSGGNTETTSWWILTYINVNSKQSDFCSTSDCFILICLFVCLSWFASFSYISYHFVLFSLFRARSRTEIALNTRKKFTRVLTIKKNQMYICFKYCWFSCVVVVVVVGLCLNCFCYFFFCIFLLCFMKKQLAYVF